MSPPDDSVYNVWVFFSKVWSWTKMLKNVQIVFATTELDSEQMHTCNIFELSVHSTVFRPQRGNSVLFYTQQEKCNAPAILIQHHQYDSKIFTGPFSSGTIIRGWVQWLYRSPLSFCTAGVLVNVAVARHWFSSNLTWYMLKVKKVKVPPIDTCSVSCHYKRRRKQKEAVHVSPTTAAVMP